MSRLSNEVATGPVHASAIVLGRWGVLLRGPSGSGKSALAFHALEAPGFAAWVADDRVILETSGEALIAACPPAIAGRAERRHIGIEQVSHLPRARLDLVVDLVERSGLERLPDASTVRPLPDGPALPQLLVPRNAPQEALSLVRAALARLT